MNAGVGTSPWAAPRIPARAAPSVAVTRKGTGRDRSPQGHQPHADHLSVVRLATHRAAALALGGLPAVLAVEAVEYTVGLGSPALDGFVRDYLYDVLIVTAGLVCAARAF